eukprot:Polyplicarium_translucidae@DN2844_c0_g1_i1.p1
MKAASSRSNLTQKHVWPAVRELVSCEGFTSRISAAGLVASLYPYIDRTGKTEAVQMLLELCNDETPMVRRAALTKMKDMCQLADPEAVVSDMFPVINSAWVDDMEALRISALEAIGAACGRLTADQLRTLVIPIARSAVEDRSWRIRLTLAKQFNRFLAVGPVATALLPSVNVLLRDPEQDVRAALVENLKDGIRSLTSVQICTYLIPCIGAAAIDSAQQVRSNLAKLLGPVAAAVGKNETHNAILQPAIDMLSNEFQEVRLNVVNDAALLCEVLQVESLDHPIVAALVSLMKEVQWRIRHAVAEQVPRLAVHFGCDKFERKLDVFVIQPLNDSVHAVREAGIRNLEKLVDAFGRNWGCNSLVPKLLQHYRTAVSADGSSGKTTSSYLMRITWLHVCSALVAKAPGADSLLLPVMVESLKDAVPNVRFAGTNLLSDLVQRDAVQKTYVEETIVPALLSLEKDADVDVRYFVVKSLEVVRKHLQKTR